ncbi:MAG TPA: sensor histidine kinase, partial [Actinomycetospora sp.]|nr:sensor histidine kinase [Actinomycetospora sp.]
MSVRARPHPRRFRHEVLLWDRMDAYLAVTVPFVLEGLHAGMPVMVAVQEERWQFLREALGADAEKVDHVDLARLGNSPARVMPVWRRFADELAGGPARGIAESVAPGLEPAQQAEQQVHEAVLNLAIPATTPLWLLCPYDTGALDPTAVAEARRAHPYLMTSDGHHSRSPDFAGADHAAALAAQRLPKAGTVPGTVAEFRKYRKGDLARIRRFVLDRALAAGLDEDRADDLCLAVNELAANSIDHGGGDGMLRMWREPDRLVVEISDAGNLRDP